MNNKKILSNAPAASIAADCVQLATQGQVSPAPILTRAISRTISVKKDAKNARFPRIWGKVFGCRAHQDGACMVP